MVGYLGLLIFIFYYETPCKRFWFNELAIVFIVTGILTTFGLLIKTFNYNGELKF